MLFEMEAGNVELSVIDDEAIVEESVEYIWDDSVSVIVVFIEVEKLSDEVDVESILMDTLCNVDESLKDVVGSKVKSVEVGLGEFDIEAIEEENVENVCDASLFVILIEVRKSSDVVSVESVLSDSLYGVDVIGLLKDIVPSVAVFVVLGVVEENVGYVWEVSLSVILIVVSFEVFKSSDVVPVESVLKDALLKEVVLSNAESVLVLPPVLEVGFMVDGSVE